MLSLFEKSSECLESGEDNCIFDGSKISPMEESSLLEGDNDEEVEDEENTVIWLKNLVENEAKDYSPRCLESGDSSVLSSCTSLSTCDDMTSYVHDSCSLLDLEVEDSELTWEREQGYDVFELNDFPSPSYKASIRLSLGSKTDETNTSCSELSDSDEPLFWPFDQSTYWHSEFQDFICISPRRDVKPSMFPVLTKSKSDRWILHQQSNHSSSRKNDQECDKRMVFHSTPVLYSSKDKFIGSSNAIKKKVTTPSRLSISTQSFSVQRPNNTNTKEKLHKLKINTQNHHVDVFQDFVAEQVPIEKLVGLNEFDGHEGVELEFDETQFFLLRSPRRNVNQIIPLIDNEQFIVNGDKE